VFWSKHNDNHQEDIVDSAVVYLADTDGICGTDSGSSVLAI